MGGVNYEHGDLLAGHDGLLTALDVASAGRLTFDRDAWCSVSKTGGDPFEALAADLNDLVLPVLIGEPKRFNLALAQAHRAHLRSLGFDSAAAP